MRKRSIIKIGRHQFRKEAGDSQDAEHPAQEISKELALYAGKLAIGRRQISDEHFSATGSYVVEGHAASYLVGKRRAVTDEEALAAFGRKQRDDKWIAGIGVCAVGLIVGGAALGAFHPFSHENTDLHIPAATSTPLPDHTNDPAGIQGTMPGYEQTPTSTVTPVPSPTSFNFRH